MDRVSLFMSLFNKRDLKNQQKIRDILLSSDIINGFVDAKMYIGEKIDQKLWETKFEELLKLEDILFKENIKYLTLYDENYPQKLRNISSKPHILFYKGDISLLNWKFSIAIVGTRKPTTYGIWASKRFSSELAKSDVCIISGMATGVDTYAHEGALEEEGKTICVLGTPVSKAYPTSNKKLMERVLASKGLVISEYSPLEKTLPVNFAYRNRIISGLSDGILIVEAGLKSGTLITADFALEQGKNIFAVPGNINSKYSIGTNNLIRQGAILASNISDIFSEYDMDFDIISSKSHEELNLSELENKIYLCVKKEGICHIDYIASTTGINIKDVMGILNILDIKGVVNYDGILVNAVL
ncbi:DNA processing protein [Acetoanaerobium pronyense]|uniref:DNA processing protein n=1 Tax=Acetoanaerobium pronyense TaxID=1482736 RepID=A0ABS4KJ38_9FIRM|nr:DNA-processing protein DprA [Acetoanaerobium pronyense]MBP2027805.1 DNA processing protein [Acetoanaerobium pronyense]